MNLNSIFFIYHNQFFDSIEDSASFIVQNKHQWSTKRTTLLTFDQIFIAYKTGSKIQRKHQTLHWIQMRWYQNWATTLEWSPFGNITASLPFSIRNETVRFAQNNLIHLTKIDGKIESISTLPNKVTNYELNMEMNIGLSSRQQLNWIINTRCACTTDAHWKRLAFLFLFSLRVKCWT